MEYEKEVPLPEKSPKAKIELRFDISFTNFKYNIDFFGIRQRSTSSQKNPQKKE